MEHCQDNNQEICEYICQLTVVDSSFEAPLQIAAINLSKTGLKIKFKSKKLDQPEALAITPGTGLGKAMETVRKVMKKLNHAPYCGEVYAKCPKGEFY